MTDDPHQPPARDARGRRIPDAEQRSEALKERIYVTFTALAVTIATVREAEHATVGGTALTLLLTVVGTLLAVSVAEYIAQMVRDGEVPDRRDVGHILYVCASSLAVLPVPMAILGLAALGALDLAAALRIISIVLVATLVLVTLIAVRRLRVRLGVKLLVLAGVAVLGVAVLAVELAVH
ncbi:hypothetical protein [Clavibacter capsici]|uniref:Uncharacterized protein n=1 Tax=Clavibacter capsici TaxID=1874630 RepID=A0A0M3RRT4_9MICO|nr:hypothetical protein [Clavibacter capsici]ALD13855.1 hypothetical protein AES38_13880 [Clavibacter capsici]QIS40173.1 hypothetical protein GW572_14285 [Clavibacter capsici]QIS43137.1 hypothetical protein GW571_13885 [Clavibacter capsici]QIS46091.1 hypothetical protein GW570_13880 [Clavibacter capsici]